MTMTETETAPRVWIGCLGCYNAGTLAGEWVDATEADAFTVDNITAMLSTPDARAEHLGTWHPAASAHEELWVMDHDGFGGVLKGECSPMEAQRIAEVLAAGLDGLPVDAYAAWLGWSGESVSEESARDAKDAYHGEYESEKDFAQYWAEEVDGLDVSGAAWPFGHIDWESATREHMSDFWSEDKPGGVYIFSAH